MIPWFRLSLEPTQFRLTFTRRAEKLYEDFHEAADLAIRQLREDFPGPLYLAFSGGIDSELIANVLLRNQIKFTPIIIKTENTNAIESWWAEYWCHTNSVKPVIITQTAQECAQAYVRFFPRMLRIDNFTQVQTLLAYEHASKNQGHCVYGAGDINLDGDRFYCCTMDFISDLIDVGDHPTSFFMYTPELALSYIYQFDTRLDEQYNKLKFYGVPARPKIDYIGSCYSLPAVKAAMDRCFHLHGLTQRDILQHWYGTREQIINDLRP